MVYACTRTLYNLTLNLIFRPRRTIMQTVNISELRSNLLKYLETAQAGEQISVTSNGRVLATICAPLDAKEQSRMQLQTLARTAVLRDVVSPVAADWEAAS